VKEQGRVGLSPCNEQRIQDEWKLRIPYQLRQTHWQTERRQRGRQRGLFAQGEAFQEVNAETGKYLPTPGTDLSHPVPYHFDD
jgi:hypothetical protein